MLSYVENLNDVHILRVKLNNCCRNKGVGLRTCRIGLVNRQNIKVAEQVCDEHFYFHEQHLFFCVNPLLLCYRVLYMGRVAIFDVVWSF